MTQLSYGPFISRKQAQEQGLHQYFTGKPCKHGHVATRRTRGECNECELTRSRAAYKPIAWAEKEHICPVCSDTFFRSSPSGKKKYCSSKCRRKAHHEKHGNSYQYEWKAKNPERVKEIQRNHKKKQRDENPEYLRRLSRECYDRNRADRVRRQGVYQKNREDTNELFKLERRLRTRIYMALMSSSSSKACSSFELLGCTALEAQGHLEAQFLPGMSWGNYGMHGWHIDHIRPCASFDLTDPEQQKQCFHFTNLQPLWAKDNLAKADKWEAAA